jgi:hypothetical protein
LVAVVGHSKARFAVGTQFFRSRGDACLGLLRLQSKIDFEPGNIRFDSDPATHAAPSDFGDVGCNDCLAAIDDQIGDHALLQADATMGVFGAREESSDAGRYERRSRLQRHSSPLLATHPI